MKKNKAFTLVELLAVIVIIAIIALIAVPIVINTIEESEKGAFLSTADGYTRAIENKYMLNVVEGKDQTYEFSIINGKVNGESLVNAENENYNGILNFRASDNSYFLKLTNGKYCVYKDYFDEKPELKPLEYCDISLDGIYRPTIEVTDENNLTLSKKVTINFVNDVNTNKYCISNYQSLIDGCDNWVTVDDSSVEFELTEPKTVHAIVSNLGKTLTATKDITNFGQESKNPIINSLSTTSSIDSITVTVSAEAKDNSTISKYVYSIDGGSSIETSEQYYTFDSLEPYIEHTISVYVIDSKNLTSDTMTTREKTTYIPTINVTNENDLTLQKTVTIDYKSYSSDKYTNEYCVLNSSDTVDNCSWTLVNNSSV